MTYKTKEEVQKRVQEHYDILIEKGYEVLGVFLQGSQNYGLEYEDSDVDTKAIILPSFESFLVSKNPVSTTLVLENNEHIDLKDIRSMFDNFKKQNINFVEILFTEYKVINPKYALLFQPLFDNNEKIARYNTFKAIGCMVGMIGQKYKALEHPYPATVHKIEKYGYDGKQLHHMLRLQGFISNYLAGVPYKKCLKPKFKEYLIKVKKNDLYSLEEARVVGDFIQRTTNRVKNAYYETNEIFIDKEVEELLKSVLVKIMRFRFKEELS